QDISSFRYEVIGMMKGNRNSTRANKPGTAASDGSHPDGSLQYSSAYQQNKKLHLYDVTAVLQQQKSEEARESLGCLANGSAVVLTDPILKDKARKEFPKDFTDFGLFPKQNSHNPNKIYSLAEEESDSDISDWVREETPEKPLAEKAEQEENESKCLMEKEESVLEDQEKKHIAYL
ncbi:hypothetical protein M9458_030699, partial [Cirrhinus mrigala]